MDLEILFWIVFLLAPVLSRLLRGKKSKGRTPSEPPQRPLPKPRDSKPQELTPFEEALRQIQEALAEGRAEAEAPSTKPERPSTPRPELVRSAPVRLEKPRDEYRAPTPPPAKPRFFDEKFEAAAPGVELGGSEHYHQPLTADVPAQTVTTGARRRKKLTRWQTAVVDAVVLGEPRSRKRWTRRAH